MNASVKPVMPDEWQRLPLEEVLVLQRGYDLPADRRRPGAVPVVAAAGVIDVHEEFKAEAPGVITGRSGSIGHVQYVDTPFWPLNTTLYVKDFKGNDPRFVFYLLQHLRLKQYAGGSTVPSLDRKVLRKIAVDLPPLREQQRIVDVLDALTDCAACARQEADRQAAANASVLHRLLQSDGAGARAPEQTRTTLGNIASWYSGGTPTAGEPRFYGTGSDSHPWAVIADLTRSRCVTETDRRITAAGLAAIGGRLAPAGSVLVSMYGTIGQVGVAGVPLATNQAIAWGEADESKVSPAFLAVTLRHLSKGLERLGRGATQRNINREIIRSQVVTVPSREQQDAIVEIVGVGDEALEALEQHCAAVQRVQAAISADLLTGRRRIPASYDCLLSKP